MARREVSSAHERLASETKAVTLRLRESPVAVVVRWPTGLELLEEWPSRQHTSRSGDG